MSGIEAEAFVETGHRVNRTHPSGRQSTSIVCSWTFLYSWATQLPRLGRAFLGFYVQEANGQQNRKKPKCAEGARGTRKQQGCQSRGQGRGKAENLQRQTRGNPFPMMFFVRCKAGYRWGTWVCVLKHRGFVLKHKGHFRSWKGALFLPHPTQIDVRPQLRACSRGMQGVPEQNTSESTSTGAVHTCVYPDFHPAAAMIQGPRPEPEGGTQRKMVNDCHGSVSSWFKPLAYLGVKTKDTHENGNSFREEFLFKQPYNL